MFLASIQQNKKIISRLLKALEILNRISQLKIKILGIIMIKRFSLKAKYL
jgi:hypothetical protein